MCGRVIQRLPLNRLVQIARTTRVAGAERHMETCNGCPTNFLPAVRRSALDTEERQQSVQENELAFLKWGASTSYSSLINARCEEMFLKPTFRKIMRNRCVVIVSGYFQWDKGKQPHSFQPVGSDHFCLAALYSEAEEVILLTRDAAPALSGVHHRMPVILSEEEVALWLDPANTPELTRIVEQSFLAKDKALWKNIQLCKVAPHVNNLKEKSAKCLQTFAQYKQELHARGLGKFFKPKEAKEASQIQKEEGVARPPSKPKEVEGPSERQAERRLAL